MKRVTQLDLVRRMTAWEASRYHRAIEANLRGDHATAMRGYRKILARNKRCWPALFSAAVLGHHHLEHEWAAAQLAKITRAEPGFLEAWFNYGTILQHLGKYDEAERALRVAADMDPTFCGARTNLGNALLGLGRFDEAMAEFTEAMRLAPTDPEARWNRAHVLLLLGQWDEGWSSYEERWRIPGFIVQNQVTLPEDHPARPWTGQSLAGKRLVVVEEQGYGDTVLCLRYASALAGMGATVIWAVRPDLLRLVAASVGGQQVVSVHEQMPEADYLVPCMSLHHWLGVRPETVPQPEGYLRVA